MKLLPLKSAEEMEQEHTARLEAGKLRIAIGAICLAAWISIYVGGALLIKYSWEQDPYIGLADGPNSY